MLDLANLIAYWDFKKPSGDRLSADGGFYTLEDDGGVSAELGPLGEGLAAQFSGSNALKIDNAKMNELSAPEEFTIACWFRTNSLNGSGENLVSNFALTGAQRGYWLMFEGVNNLMRFSVSSDGSSSAGKWANAEITGVYADHSKEIWKHVVAVYKDNVATLILDGGEKIASGSKTESGVHPSTANFYVGKDQDGRNLSGGIADLSIWDVALSDEEIRYLFHNGISA